MLGSFHPLFSLLRPLQAGLFFRTDLPIAIADIHPDGPGDIQRVAGQDAAAEGQLLFQREFRTEVFAVSLLCSSHDSDDQ